MTQQLNSSDFETALGVAPNQKQNLPGLEVGPLLASDIPSVNIGEAVKAVTVAGHSNVGMPSPHLYVPALSEPSHPMKAQSRNGQWFEMARSVDLRHFGPVVDNRGSDIGLALRNFVDYAKEKGGGSVMIPPGIFSLESPVEADIDLPNDNLGIGIFGSGTEISRIVVDGASVSNGPKFTATNRAAFFQFERFAILADGVVSGRPLTATMPIGGSRRNCSHIVRDLLVQGWDAHLLSGSPYSDHFTNGFDFTGAWRLMFENNHISGPIVNAIKTLNDWSDSSILWRMEDGLVIDGAYAPVVRDIQFYFVARPVICRGHPDGAQEAGNVEAERAMFHNVRCPTCKTAIEWFRTGAEPELVITDCFFDYRDAGVNIKGSRLGQIFRNAFFQKTDTDTSRVVPADIILEHCIDFNIDHNLHHEAGDTRRVGIRLLDTSTQDGYRTDRIEIRKNHVSDNAVIDTYLVKGANTGEVVYEPGAFEAVVSAEVNDASATAKTELNLRSAYVLALTIDAPGQSLSSGSWQSLDWTSASRIDPKISDAWAVSTPNQIVIPSNRGISKVQARVNVEFEDTGGGVRRVQVLKNGTPTNDLNIAAEAVTGAPTAVGGTTDWISVAEGDILELQVYQASGTACTTGTATTMTLSFR